MPRWIRRTALSQFVGLLVMRGMEEAEAHRCEPPTTVDAGPRSVWECDCGRRWRLAVPCWRPLDFRPDLHSDFQAPGWFSAMRERPSADGTERL